MMPPVLGILLVALSVPPPPDEPTLADCTRFPPGEVCQQMEDFARGHLEWLRSRQALCRTFDEEREWAAIYDEARWCFDCTDWAGAAAGCEGMDGPTRLRALARLRELLGEDDYQAGRLPPPVPVWRFRRLD